jgi:hypothetical protein
MPFILWPLHFFSKSFPFLLLFLCSLILGLGLIGGLLLPDALWPCKIYCASPSIISQLVLFLWQTVDIDPLGHVRVVESLQNFVQKCDPLILSEIYIHIAGVQQFHCRWDTFCTKDLCPFQFYVNDHIGQNVLWADQ